MDTTLTVDVERPKPADGLGTPQRPKAPDMRQIELSILGSLTRAGLVDGSARELWFCAGTDLPPSLLPDRGAPPLSAMSPEAARNAARSGEAGPRRYLWMRRAGWGAEVAVSYFLRLERAGGDLTLELHGVAAGPIDEKYRWVDRVAPRSWRSDLRDVAESLLGGLAMPFVSAGWLLMQLNQRIGELLTDPAKIQRREALANPAYNYGAPQSLRARATAKEALYFQHMDQRLAERSFTGRILRAFIDALDAHGIDTSELREQRSTLLNQGIIVQGGDLKAQNVAAGVGAAIRVGLGGKKEAA